MSANQIHVFFDKDEIEDMWNITFDSDEKWNNFVKSYEESFISKMEDAIQDPEFREDIIDRAKEDHLCRDNLDDDDDNLDDDVGLWIGSVSDDEFGLKELREPQRIFESDKDYAERLADADELEILVLKNRKKSLEAELESLKADGETK